MSRNRAYIVLALILLSEIMVSIFFSSHKKGMHYDENYSYYSSNATYGPSIPDREFKSGEEMRSEYVVLEGERFNYSRVYMMQTYDVHPPLYYVILHTVSSLFVDSFSIWIGVGINIIFYVIGYIMLLLITHKITDANYKLDIIVALVYGFSPGIYSGITFIRMYQMLMALTLMLLYLQLLVIDVCNQRGSYVDKNSNDSQVIMNYGDRIKKRYLYILTAQAIITLIGILTHYYFLIFTVCVGGYVLCYMIVVRLRTSKRKGELYDGNIILKQIIMYCVSYIIAGISALIIYPSMGAHIIRGYRGEEAIGAFFDISNTFSRFAYFGKLIDDFVYVRLQLVLIIFIIFVWVSAIRLGYSIKIIHNISSIVMLIITASGYFVVVSKTALLNGEEAIRYLLPIFPIIILVTILILFYPINYIINCEGNEDIMLHKYSSKYGLRRFSKIATYGIVLVWIGLEIYSLNNGKLLFIYPECEERIEDAKSHHDMPVTYIYNSDNRWMVWDEGLELMQYDRIYYADIKNEIPIDVEAIIDDNDTEMLVYMCHSDDEANKMREILELDSSTRIDLVYNKKFCNLYRVEYANSNAK